MSVESEAESIVHDYAWKQMRKAVKDAEGKRKGDGCQCKSCLGAAMTEANQWLDYCSPEIEGANDFHYELVPKPAGGVVLELRADERG